MIDLKDLLKAGVHFGHKASRWSPSMRPFIWGTKNNIHLIDIAKTAFLLERAGKYLQGLASDGKSVLWIGTKKAAVDIIKNHATELNMPFVINRWIGGTLTNFEQVKKAITRFLHLKDVIKKGASRYKKKEISMIQKEIGRLEKNVGGITNLEFPPGAAIVVDAKKEHSAIREAVSAHIPIIAMVDTNTDPSGINFLIPANDDSPRSISFVLGYLAQCIEDGKEEFIAKKAASDAALLEEKNARKPKPAIKKAVPSKEKLKEAKEQPLEQGQETDRLTKPELKKELENVKSPVAKDKVEKIVEKIVEKKAAAKK